MPRSRKLQATRPLKRPPNAGARSWLCGKGPLLRFVLGVIGVTAVLSWVLHAPFFEEPLAGYLEVLSHLAGTVLNWCGQSNQVTGPTIWSAGWGITVAAGCSGTDSLLLLLSAILCFPASWVAKAWGIAAGTCALVALNFVRIISLYAVGLHFPSAFNYIHEDAWAVVLIVAVLGICLGWMNWVGQKSAQKPHETV